MKLALHRSLTFWSGLSLMIFLGWAWWDSRSFDSYMQRGSLFAGNLQNSLVILAAGEVLNPGFTAERVSPERTFPAAFPPPFILPGGCDLITAESTDSRGQMAAASGLMQLRPPGAWAISIPHWLALMGVAGTWGGLLAWRVKRRRKGGSETAVA